MANDQVELDTDDLEDAVSEQLGAVESAANAILEEETPQVDEAEGKKDVILLFKEKCLTCTHLFPEGGKKVFNSCHYSSGNEDCPARALKLVVMVPAERVSDLMVEAMLSNDVVRLAELSARLNRKDPAEIDRVMRLVRTKIAATA